MTTVTYVGEGRCHGCEHYGLAPLYRMDDDPHGLEYCSGCAHYRGADV